METSEMCNKKCIHKFHARSEQQQQQDEQQQAHRQEDNRMTERWGKIRGNCFFFLTRAISVWRIKLAFRLIEGVALCGKSRSRFFILTPFESQRMKKKKKTRGFAPVRLCDFLYHFSSSSPSFACARMQMCNICRRRGMSKVKVFFVPSFSWSEIKSISPRFPTSQYQSNIFCIFTCFPPERPFYYFWLTRHRFSTSVL